MDECLTPANKCKFKCKNLIGSFICICPDGYEQVGSADDCRDIDECFDNPNLCENGRCVNMLATYKCECFDGFKPSADGKRCIGAFVLVLIFSFPSAKPLGCTNTNYVNNASVDSIADNRTGLCYSHLVNGRCVNEVGLKSVPRMDCCCTMGAAWGPFCQICPSPRTREYQRLCSSSGFSVDGHGNLRNWLKPSTKNWISSYSQFSCRQRGSIN